MSEFKTLSDNITINEESSNKVLKVGYVKLFIYFLKTEFESKSNKNYCAEDIWNKIDKHAGKEFIESGGSE